MRQLLLSTAAASFAALTLAACSTAFAEQSPAALAGGETASFSADDLIIEDFIGTIVVKTGPGLSSSVVMDAGDAVADGDLKAPTLRETKDGFVIAGDDDAKVKNCSSSNNKQQIQLKGHSKRPLSDFPTVTVTAPSSIEIDLELRGGLAEIGDVAEADIGVFGCGDVMLGDVAGELEASVSGSGDIATGSAAEVDASIHGSGDIRIGVIAGDAELAIAGSGDIQTGRIGGTIDAGIAGSGDIRASGGTGELEVGIRGSGDVRIEDVAVDEAELSIAGSGDIRIGGVVGELDVSIAGSGDIMVEKATGDIDVSRMGSGDIIVNDQRWTKKGWVAR